MGPRVVLAWIAGSVTLLAASQSIPPQGQAVFRAAVDLIHLDVSVLDRSRRPVRGLKADDFTILEDGTARPVAAFVELQVKDPMAVASQPALVDKAPADIQTNETATTPEGRLFVVILDDAMIPKEPQMSATARKIAETAIDRLSPGDQMAVVFTVNSRGAQNFTSDKTKLLKAVDTFNPGYATHVLGWDNATYNQEKNTWERQVDGDDGYRAGSIRTLEMVAESLIAAPQRRKAIFYVSTGVFADADGAASIVKVAPGQSMMIREANNSLVGRLPALYRRMREANVTIYALDPAGLGGLEDYVQKRASGLVAIRAAKRNMTLADDWFNPTDPPMAMDLSRKIASVDLDFLKAAASNTGGLAITDTNDLTGGIERIFNENNAYYLIGFNVPPGHKPGSIHRLEVRVNRPDVTVRTRSGYSVPEPAPDPAAGSGGKPAASPAAVILAGPVPAGTLPMRIAVAPIGPVGPGQREVAIAIALGLENPVTENSAQTLEVELRALSTEGRVALAERRTAQAILRPAAAGIDGVFDLLARIALAPGRYELRFGAHLTPANLAGSLFADVEVPDFERDPLTLSGVIIETSGGNAGPLGVFSGLIPIIPTSSRVFTARGMPESFVRVYQGGRDPLALASIRVTLHDRSDYLVFNNRFRLPANRFDATTRAADFRFKIPTNALSPGPYLLTFEAQLGTRTVSRQVKFTYR